MELDNYNIKTINNGDAVVDKADLTVKIGNASTTYGTAFDKNEYSYTIEGNTNGDSVDSVKGSLGVAADDYNNAAAKDGKGDVWTANAGTHTAAISIGKLDGMELDNYNIKTINNGDATVKQAHITITVYDKSMYVGDKQPEYTGSIDGYTNGDTSESLFGNYQYGLGDSSVTLTVGEYANAIGIFIDGKYYGLDSSWNNLSQNYTYEVKPGTLTVDPVPYGSDPQNPDWWDAEDKYPWYQWDKQRNERERKAEIHFVDGGMTIH